MVKSLNCKIAEIPLNVMRVVTITLGLHLQKCVGLVRPMISTLSHIAFLQVVFFFLSFFSFFFFWLGGLVMMINN